MALKSDLQKASYIHPLSENFDKELHSNYDFKTRMERPAIVDPTNNITRKVVIFGAKNEDNCDRHLTKIGMVFSKVTTPYSDPKKGIQ